MKKIFGVLTLLTILSLVLASCAQQPAETPTPETVIQTVVVTEQGQTVVQTVVVTQEVQVQQTAPVSDNVVDVMGTWSGTELESFQNVVYPFTDETGISMSFEGTRDMATLLTTRVEAGNPPEIAIMANPGQMQEFASRGQLTPLNQFMDMSQLQSDYAQTWLDLGSYNGDLYGIFYKAAVKSLVWYVPANFEANGYEIPNTWDEMIALSDQIVADGGTPWCLGIESGAASGWPATDWVEDIMLRTAGPDVYDQWIAHDIAWTSDPVKNAVEMFGTIARSQDYVVGGPAGVNSISFQDSPKGLFTDPPECYMHRQASFVTQFFPADVTPDQYDFFLFPEINPDYGKPIEGAADIVVMLRDTPEAEQMMQYLATAGAQEIWAQRGGFLSPNKQVDLSAYPDDLTRKQAELLTQAEIYRFDASDLMPAAVGSSAFFSGMVNYVAGDDIDTVLQNIEQAAQDAYGS
jgi:alpha-glucoside transport system substrate-binding protein